MKLLSQRKKSDILKNVSGIISSKIIGHNVVEYVTEEGRFIRYHDTDILFFSADANYMRISSGGYHTKTTALNINRFLPAGFSLRSDNGFWYIHSDKNYAFCDRLIFNLSTRQAEDSPDYARARRHYFSFRRQVNNYIHLYAKTFFNNSLQKPNLGDCLYCQIAAQDAHYHNKDHLLFHIKEKYLVPSLIVAAAIAEDASPFIKNDIAVKLYKYDGNAFFHDNKRFVRLLRNYFRNQGI